MGALNLLAILARDGHRPHPSGTEGLSVGIAVGV